MHSGQFLLKVAMIFILEVLRLKLSFVNFDADLVLILVNVNDGIFVNIYVN